MREVKGGFANSVFRTVFTALRAFLKSGFCATQLCIRSGIVSWMPLNSSLSNVPSCSCSLIRRPPCLTLCWIWRGFLVLVPGRWTACWSSNPKAQVLLLEGYAIGWGGKAVSRGRVLFVRSSTTSSSRRQCDGGGGSGLFSDSDSFYQLCQLSALPASILGLSEQTKTGATRGRGRQSRRKPMPQAVLARRPIQYTSRLVFAFFWLDCR